MSNEAVFPTSGVRLKRKYKKRGISDPLPPLPAINPLAAAQEAMHHAQEGSLKLSRSVDVLRTALETVVMAKMDNQTKLPVTTKDLKEIAVTALNEYSVICGQSWRKHKLVGNWAGDRDLSTLEG